MLLSDISEPLVIVITPVVELNVAVIEPVVFNVKSLKLIDYESVRLLFPSSPNVAVLFVIVNG